MTLIERETLDSSLMSGRKVLELMGCQAHAARNQALRFRQHTIGQIEQMLISLAKQGRQQLEQVWAQEREQQQAQRHRQGLSVDPPPPG